MSDRPRLRAIDQIPEALRGTDYARHIVRVLEFTPENRRVLTPEMRGMVLRRYKSGAEPVLDQLAAVEKFLSHTFVFDDLDPQTRENLRDRLARDNPVASEWYESHMLRINQITALLENIRPLADFADGTLRKILLAERTATERIDDMGEDVRHRWKRDTMIVPDITMEEQHFLKRDFYENKLAPLVQEVFDAALWNINGRRPTPTLPDGNLSQTMRELMDMEAANKRGMEAQKRRDDDIPER